jgi:hypothetical protein
MGKKNNKNSGATNVENPKINSDENVSKTPTAEKKPATTTVTATSEKKSNSTPVVNASNTSVKKANANVSSSTTKKTIVDTENDGDDEEEDDEGEEEEEEDDEEEEDNSPMIVLKHDIQIRQRATAAAAKEENGPASRDLKFTEDDSDDTLIIASAIFGFLLCMLCGGLLPQFGVDPQHVMVGGMLTMLLLVIYNMLCPNCGGRKSSTYNDPDSQISPFMVFLFCGCIGAMLGGMFGGVFVNLDFKKFPKDHWVRFISGK